MTKIDDDESLALVIMGRNIYKSVSGKAVSGATVKREDTVNDIPVKRESHGRKSS
jgi:hypothetical protein